MKKILLCDDSMLIRVQVKNFLEENYENIQVLEAEDGKEALEIFSKESPDLIIMDIVMPKANGLETIKEIKKINDNANIIVLSSVGNKDILQKALKAGASNFIQKPWSESILKKSMKPFI